MDALNLVPWTAEAEKQPVGVAIGRMNEQCGSFRDLTETELEEDTVRAIDSLEAVSEDEDEDPVAKRRQELQEAKTKIMQGLQNASQEAAIARDFVSLLLTNDKINATATLSVETRNITGVGTLGKELVYTKIDPESNDQKLAAKRDVLKQQATAMGIKLKSLNSSADTLLAAAQRLEDEMRKEARHWEDLSALKSNGWTLSRNPRDPRTLGVRLSALESAPEYREKGFVKIGRDAEGRVELDVAAELAQGRRLRVQVKSQGKIVAASLSDSDAMSEDSLHATLQHARDSLFDEELFHELSREAATLWSRNVKWTDQGIILPLSDDSEAVVSLIVPGDYIEVAKESASAFHGQVANILAPVLRILLSYNFRHIYRKRAGPPSPLSARKPPRLVLPILLPLLDRSQYQTIQQSLDDFVEGLVLVLRRAAITVDLDRPQDDMGLRDVIEKAATLKQSFVEATVAKLCQLPPTTHLIQVKDAIFPIKVQFQISSKGPEYRYEIADVSSTSMIKQLPQSMVFSDLAQFQDAILHLFQLRIAEHIHSKLNPNKWSLDSPQTGEMHTIDDRASLIAAPSVQLIRISLFRRRLSLLWRTPANGTEVEQKWVITPADDQITDIAEIIAQVNKRDHENTDK